MVRDILSGIQDCKKMKNSTTGNFERELL